MKKNIVSILIIASAFLVIAGCSSPKPATVSKEKKEQMDKDKSNFDNNH
jgi:PBP1b-binding outer membrane lipoprotein LpoB